MGLGTSGRRRHPRKTQPQPTGVPCLRAAWVLAPSLLPGTDPDSRGSPRPRGGPRGGGHGGAGRRQRRCAGTAGREKPALRGAEGTPRARLSGPRLCLLSTCPGWQRRLTWICPVGSFSPASKPFPRISQWAGTALPPAAPSSPPRGTRTAPATLGCSCAHGASPREPPERGEDVLGTLPGLGTAGRGS